MVKQPPVPPCNSRWLEGYYRDRWGNFQLLKLEFSPSHADVRSVGVLPYARYVYLEMNDGGEVGQAYLQYSWYKYLENRGPQWGFWGVFGWDWPVPGAAEYDLRLEPGRQHIFGAEYEDRGVLCLCALKMQWDPP